MMLFKAYWFSLLLWPILIFLLLKLYVAGRFGRFLDSANERSSHQGEVLTGGGFLLFMPLTVLMLWQQQFLLAAMVGGLTLLGAVDDVKALSAGLRFSLQLLVTVITLWMLDFQWSLWWLFLGLALLWWLNLFNFMDGANGLVALHAIVTLVSAVLMANFATSINLIIACTVISLLVYLYFNIFLKALFMGDSGSLPLAFIIAFTALIALSTDMLSAMQIAVMHAVLITDSTLTLALRGLKGEPLSQAHRSHLYQRLIAQKSAHWPVSVAYAGVTVLCCGMAFMMSYLSIWQQGLSLFGVYLLLSLVFFHSRHLGR